MSQYDCGMPEKLSDFELKPTSFQLMQDFIHQQCEIVKNLLISKNKKYGNSAAEPCSVFSKGTALEQIAVRCDDKLKRIQNMGGLEQVLKDAKNAEEDTVLDLIGYLILAKVVHGKDSGAFTR